MTQSINYGPIILVLGAIVLVLIVLAVFFLVQWLKTRTVMKRSKTPFAGLGKESSLTDILATFDTTFLTGKLREYQQLRKDCQQLHSYLDGLLEVNTPDGLLAALDNMRIEHPHIPVVDCVDKLYAEAVSSSDKDFQQISALLSRVDEKKGSQYAKLYESYVKIVTESSQMQMLLASYQKVAKSYLESIQPLNEDGKLDYWDRLALILWSITRCGAPLLELEKTEDAAILKDPALLENIKNDFTLSYLTRYFLKYAADANETVPLFRDHLSQGIQKALAGYNTLVKEEVSVSIPQDNKYVQEKAQELVNAFTKLWDGREARPFMDKMWQFFVQDFQKTMAEDNPDKTALLGQAMNIAFHTADFLDHTVGGRGTDYCYNYAFLLNDLDPVKSGSQNYRYQDYSQSTKRSDFVFSCAEELGIQHLKILVDNYYIKP